MTRVSLFALRFSVFVLCLGLSAAGGLSGRITEYKVPTPEEGPQLVLSFATYLGGSGMDDCDAVAVDHSGNIYLACHSNSKEFPLATSTPEKDRERRRKSSTSEEDYWDAFVVKLDPTGSRVLYTTSLGGSRWEGAFAITVDASGNVYVAGATESPDFPTTEGAFQTSFGGDYDVFVAKLDASGAVVYCTYLGGSGEEDESDIAVDEAGNVYVVGTTQSKDFPTTEGGLQRALAGKQDAFVAKLDATGSALLYSTYVGGQEDEEGWGIALDGEGNACITGQTRSKDFFTTPGAIQGSLAGGADVFVSKLDPGGSSLLYSTYLGGAGEEHMADDGGNIAIDAQGHLYVAGTTESHNFPTTPNAFQRNFAAGKADAFLAKLDLANSRLVYSTYLGGGGGDHATGVAVDAQGQACMTVQTDSADFPTQAPAQAVFAGCESDAFIVKFDQDGSRLLFATYLGGTGGEFPEDIALDGAGNVYVSGSATSTDFPTAAAIQATYAGGRNDIILARFDQRSGPATGGKLTGRITEYVVPTPESLPHDPAVDPQGRVWYTGQRANLLGRFDPETETFQEFRVPTPDSGPHGLVSDEQGNIWFTENYVGKVGRLDPRTGRFREFVAPIAKDPHTPVFGPDGRLWFTSQRSNLVVRFNVKNFNMKEIRVPTPDARPYGIVAGPDGRMWFCELAAGKLAAIRPGESTIVEYVPPTPDSGPRRLAADAEAIWVTEYRAGQLARFDVKTEQWREWPSPSGKESRPYGIALAADGSVWYNEAGANKMVRFDPRTESFETFPLPSPRSVVRHMVRDSRGRLWLAVSGPQGTDNNQIARVD
ncbi:MAG: SBBP repeat-containing protein [Acidobacteria bacterium]|nr:SBBP repeat-containing protein [Acidobacteriota bacterium]